MISVFVEVTAACWGALHDALVLEWLTSFKQQDVATPPDLGFVQHLAYLGLPLNHFALVTGH